MIDAGGDARGHFFVAGFPVLLPILGIARQPRPIQADVPLSESPGALSLCFEIGGQGHPALANHCRCIVREHALLQVGAPGVATGEQTIAGRRTDRRWRVRVGEADPLPGNSINPGCFVHKPFPSPSGVAVLDQEDATSHTDQKAYADSFMHR